MIEKARYGSDLMVDVLKGYDIPYVALNPGSSFRGLHDSLVNYGAGSPAIIQCTHEKIALGIAHGYAKASGRIMAAAVHNVVGLLNSSLGVYFAYADRIPLLLLGGAGPMALEHRRPRTDWFHVANMQGNAVRDFTKWDDQPHSIESVAPSMARGYKQATTQPTGPVYIALDAGLQEMELSPGPGMPDFDRLGTPSRLAADPAALVELAEMMLEAKCPVLIPGYLGENPDNVAELVQLAEMLGAAVVDTNIRLNFPNRHPLNLRGTDVVAEADLVVLLDVQDPGVHLARADWSTRSNTSLLRPNTKVASLGLADLSIGSWSHEFGGLYELDLEILSDPSLALPALKSLCEARLTEETQTEQTTRIQRKQRFAAIHADRWTKWRTQAQADADLSPVATSRLCEETWKVIQNYDWVLTAGTANDWALRIWDFDAPYRHPGASLGAASQFALSLGVALAHKGSGRLVVDLQPDGDMLFDIGALWTAAYYDIPILLIMVNNRAYYNDMFHQELIARERNRPVENAHIGQELTDPAPDFAKLARAFGWHATGPIEDPAELSDAIAEAAHYVSTHGRPALVDVICQLR